MAQLPIYTYSASVLKEPTKEVKRIHDDIISLIFNMFETMHKADGVGLAANQVGEGHSICIIDLSHLDKVEQRYDPLVLINPKITDAWGDEIPIEEGCLSIPNVREEILRPEMIHIKYRDPNFESKELEADGFLARVIQHEVDHLNGIYFTDHLKGLKKRLIMPQLNKIKKGYVEVDYPVILNASLVTA